MPITQNDDDITNALNIARADIGNGNAIQAKVGGLNQALTGLDLEANTPQFNTGIGGAGMPSAPVRQVSPLGYYSHAAEVAQSLQPSGSASQLISTLKNQPGIKPEELMNAGLIDAQGNVHPEWAGRGKITREDLAGHLQSSMPQVQETVLGGNPKPPQEILNGRQRIFDQYTPWIHELQQEHMDYNLLSYEREAAFEKQLEVQDKMVAHADREYPLPKPNDNPKYSDYTLPGGENYREVLLHLPEQQKQLTEYRVMRPDGVADSRYTSIQEAAKRAAEINGTVSDPIVSNIIGGFHSQHFPQPDILAHLRMADRTGPNGEKILHVEEVQSDWGQKGRDEGFFNLELKKQKQDLMDKKNALVEQQKASRRELLDQYKIDKQPFEDAYASFMQPYEDRFANESHKKSFMDEYNAASDKALEQHKNLLDPAQEKFNLLNKQNEDNYHSQIKELNDQYRSLPKNGSIPSAPYVTNTGSWTDLALKRALREAAEGGYDKLVWTPGAEQAGRYDLSKQLSAIDYHEPSGTLSAYDHSGRKVISNSYKPEELPNVIGKDVTKKLMESDPQDMGVRSLSGLDLSVGGEGMKEYYDKIVPNQLKKIAKHYDPNAKVGYTDVMLPPSGKAGTNNPPMAAPGLDITPQMREAIMRGQKAFKRGGRTSNDDIIKHALRLATGGRAHFDDGGDVRHGYSVDGMVKPYDNAIEMPHSLKELQNWHKTHPAPQPMVRASDDPTSILYNERKLDMPNSLQELQNWARVHHASGGNIHDEIAKALHLARNHFGFGGDADTAEGSRYSENISHEAPPNQENDNKFDGRMGRGQPETGDPIQHEVIGSRDFGSGINVGGGNFTGHDMPTGLINYTTQRETTPYEGTPMTAAQDPSTAFGMAYPSLVNIQNTPAGAAALLANLGYESTQGGKAFQPNAISSSGYGLAQWTDPTRQAAFFNAMQPGTTTNDPIAKMAILGTTTPGQQLGYAMNEIQQKYPSVAREMATTKNIPSATENIMNKYESPATNESLDARIALANQIAKGTGMGSFSREALNQSPSGNSFAGISPSVSSAVRNAMGAGRGDVGILDSSLAKATALNTAGNTGTVIDEGAVNSPNVTPEATTGTTVADTAPRIPVDSLEDPALIAAYNAQYGLSGPKNTRADMALGQRSPNVTTNNPLVNTVQGLNNILTDIFTPNYKLGSDEYNKISQNPEPVQSTHEGRGGDGQQPYIPYIPPVVAAATPPVVPGTPVPFTYQNQNPYVNYGAYGSGIGNIKPISYGDPINWALVPGYRAAGGRVGENNALANVLRMLAQNR